MPDERMCPCDAHPDHEQRIRTLEEDRYRRDEREKGIFTELGAIKATLTQLVSKPAQRWETLTTDILKVVVAAGVGYLLSFLKA